MPLEKQIDIILDMLEKTDNAEWVQDLQVYINWAKTNSSVLNDAEKPVLQALYDVVIAEYRIPLYAYILLGVAGAALGAIPGFIIGLFGSIPLTFLAALSRDPNIDLENIYPNSIIGGMILGSLYGAASSISSGKEKIKRQSIQNEIFDNIYATHEGRIKSVIQSQQSC